jgi:hypothetical protein
VASGGIGKSGIADRGAVLGTSDSEAPEVFRRGISSSLQSTSVAPALEFFRRDRRDIFRVNASVASFAIDEIDVFRWVGDGSDSGRTGLGCASEPIILCICGFGVADDVEGFGDCAWNPRTGLSSTI